VFHKRSDRAHGGFSCDNESGSRIPLYPDRKTSCRPH
jgi:hypothetical protein